MGDGKQQGCGRQPLHFGQSGSGGAQIGQSSVYQKQSAAGK